MLQSQAVVVIHVFSVEYSAFGQKNNAVVRICCGNASRQTVSKTLRVWSKQFASRTGLSARRLLLAVHDSQTVICHYFTIAKAGDADNIANFNCVACCQVSCNVAAHCALDLAVPKTWIFTTSNYSR